MQKWRQHDKMAVYWNFPQFRVVKDDLKLFCNVYIMLCHVLDPNLGLIVFILNEQLFMKRPVFPDPMTYLS